MIRVPFDVTSTLFFLSTTIRCHLKTIKVLKAKGDLLGELFYVHNFITGKPTEAKALHLYIEASNIIIQTPMPFKNWPIGPTLLQEIIETN